MTGTTDELGCHWRLARQCSTNSRKLNKLDGNLKTGIDTQNHRKLVKHYDEPGQVHELTFSCYQRYPLLNNNRSCFLLSTSINRAMERHGFELIAFIYMPEHIHLLVYPILMTSTISKLLYAIKRPFSTKAKRYLESINSKWLSRLNVRERPGKHCFRFWQEGPGYDRNLVKEKTIRKSIDYIHYNPVRRELCSSPDQWKWSSWYHYFELERSIDNDLPNVHGLSGKSKIFID